MVFGCGDTLLGSCGVEGGAWAPDGVPPGYWLLLGRLREPEGTDGPGSEGSGW